MRNLNALLEPVRAEAKLPALAAALVERGKLTVIGAVGRRRADSDEPVQRGDRFHIGSNGKAMTATLIAQLVEAGKLDWANMVAEVLPQIRRSIRREYWKATVEQLLTHRAGLPEDRAPDPQVFPRLWALRADQRLQAAEIILQQTPVRKPGEKVVYSNGGYVVAGAIAEAVGGKVWEELAALLRAWADPARGYTARMALLAEGSSSDYDHLSRFGEWDRSSVPVRQVLT